MIELVNRSHDRIDNLLNGVRQGDQISLRVNIVFGKL